VVETLRLLFHGVFDEDEWIAKPLRLEALGFIETSYLPLARDQLKSTSYSMLGVDG
jgi:hypothetical protein